MKIKHLTHKKIITDNKKKTQKWKYTEEKSKQRAGWAGKLAIQANIVRHRGERHGVTLFQRLDTDWLSDQGHVIQGCQLYPRLLLIGQFSVGRYLTTRAVRVNHLVPTLWLNATELFSLILKQMLHVKNNYKNAYRDLTCRACQKETKNKSKF